MGISLIRYITLLYALPTGFFALPLALAFQPGLFLTWLLFVSVIGGFALGIFLGKSQRFLWYSAIVYWILFSITVVYFGLVSGYFGMKFSDTNYVWSSLFILMIIYGLSSILYFQTRKVKEYYKVKSS